MKNRRNKIIIVLVAAMTFGSLSAARAHHMHHKKCQFQKGGEHHYNHCWFDSENNEGLEENLNEEQH